MKRRYGVFSLSRTQDYSLTIQVASDSAYEIVSICMFSSSHVNAEHTLQFTCAFPKYTSKIL